jgi:hypothetical protein
LHNVNNAEFWIQYCNFTVPILNGAATAAEVIGTLREAAQALLDLKEATPLEPVPPDERYTQAFTGFEALRAAIGEYNSAVAATNAIIEARKRQAEAANLGKVENELARLKAFRARHKKGVKALCRTDIDVLQRYFSIGEGRPRDVIQKIRPVLEGSCRNLFPAQFLDGEMMGVIVGKIRAAGPSHTLYPIADELDEINVYCRRYYHAENPNAATEVIDDTELQGYVKRTLSLTGSLI